MQFNCKLLANKLPQSEIGYYCLYENISNWALVRIGILNCVAQWNEI